jgi:hypothetical protein
MGGLIHKDETNPRWFGFKGGKHVLIRSFHAHGLMSPELSHEKRKAFLDWAQKQAYNTFSVSNVIARDAWPIDLDRFRRTEAILNDLSARRIMVYPFQGFFHGGSELSPATPAEREFLLRYVLARLGVYWNLILNASGPEPNLRNIIKPPEVERLGATIHRFDIFHHLLGVHNKDGNDPYRDAAWTSYATLQHEIADLKKLGDYYLSNHTGDKPVYAHEMCWPGNTLQFDKEPVKTCTMERLRGQMWVAMMSQTAFNTGDMNGRSNSGFSGSTDLADKVQERHDLPKMIWDLLEKLTFYRMNPRQDLVSTGFALVDPGQTYLVYLPEGGEVNVKVDPGKTYSVSWVNPGNTREARLGGTTTDGSGLKAPAPRDWLLHLQALHQAR